VAAADREIPPISSSQKYSGSKQDVGAGEKQKEDGHAAHEASVPSTDRD